MKALEDLKAMRLSEGAALAGFWANRSTASRTDPRGRGRSVALPEAIRARLAEQVAPDGHRRRA
jgi:hypothetical protein